MGSERIRTAAPVCLLAGLLAVFAGCAGAPGRIYTHVVVPESTDFHETPIGAKRCVLDEHQIRVPVDRHSITAEWSTDRIAAEAKAAGIERIAYTEREVLSILFGLYTRRRLIVHGD